ncbi:hypothetical protein IEQ34_004471 [Dendrobium chrysotoxum]|uniref:Uncharacterized protein n=1 Tax=Dendrobium chrysotoxum TaxID=161865 RepID=A0AAV7HGS8_DENCH|nr:hypothetical protein IEQ34_004471 [Dendrobium chrysotoxum]
MTQPSVMFKLKRIDHYLREEHLHPSLKQQRSPPHAIHRVDRHQRGHHVDCSSNNGRHRRVEHDGVDASELLEYLHDYSNYQLWPIPPLQEVAERVFHLTSSVAGLHNFFELGVHVVGAANAAEHGTALLEPAALDEAVRGVNDKEGADGEEEGGDAGKGER